MRFIMAAALALGLAAPASADMFTDAAEARPILGMTRANWIAVREFDGQDLLYFTHLASYRCALSDIRYGVNSDQPILSFVPEPCYRDEATPYAIKPDSGAQVYVAFPLNHIRFVTVRITYADGVQETAKFDRSGALID
ncbi:hypothetical protein [Actibacterium sp. MT2.3-13A]|uniref:hypothetical protein n=1 Tax=Actibacterium sp. MT2.3-13A TaxID=2828332 RepID=UPI002013BE6F|nr:hypothetical protein [Actibacterium sp. MT2.3-13A]